MRKHFTLTFLKLCILILFEIYSSKSSAQNALLLYASDFTKWGAMNGTNSNLGEYATGDGAGFYLFSKPQVKPSASTPDGKTGVICSENSTNYIDFKPFDFISGGTVEIEFYNYKNQKVIILSGVTVTGSSIDNQPATPLPVSKISGSVFTSGNNFGPHKISFTFSDTGTKTLRLSTTAKCGEIDITSFKVYSRVGTLPYVVSTNYPAAPAKGLSISGVKGGNSVSGTVNIKGWNLSDSVSLKIIGSDSARFNLPISKISKEHAAAGQNIAVNFVPSVMAGVKNAQLEISAKGAPDYIINLTGITSTAISTPEIISDTTTIPFWTSLIDPKSKTIKISGVNLTGNVNLSISGTDANYFSISSNNITPSSGTVSQDITIKYIGNITVGTQTASLTISSPGAQTVVIPLVGITSELRPFLRKLKFTVEPAGSGYAITNPQGQEFLNGTTISVTAIPETGYKFEYWSDGRARNKTARTITIGELTPEYITAYFVPGTQPPPPPPNTQPFVAYVPTNITDSAFKAMWATVPGATGYLVSIYDKLSGGTLINTFPVNSGTTDNIIITRLTPGKCYTYKVETTGGVTPAIQTPIVGPFKTTGAPFNCGMP